jgi:tellurite methyltransferase
MQRTMTGFHRDAEGHWVAELACGHAQHVRHQPPFWLRPWVLTEEGRAERLGQTLDCAPCDRRQMPEGHVSYKRTPSFRRDAVPAGLLREHRTKPGVWGLVHVRRGALLFHEVGSGEPRRVSAGEVAVVLPEVEHHVEPLDELEFFVEFWKAPDPASR